MNAWKWTSKLDLSFYRPFRACLSYVRALSEQHAHNVQHGWGTVAQ